MEISNELLQGATTGVKKPTHGGLGRVLEVRALIARCVEAAAIGRDRPTVGRSILVHELV